MYVYEDKHLQKNNKIKTNKKINDAGAEYKEVEEKKN